MATKLKVFTYREDDNNLYVKNLDGNNKPVGPEMAITWDEWDVLENKQRLMKNVWEFEVPPALRDMIDRDTKRIEWLIEPSRIFNLIMASHIKEPDLNQLHRLSGILRQYQEEFPEDSILEFAKYTREAIAIAKAMLENA